MSDAITLLRRFAWQLALRCVVTIAAVTAIVGAFALLESNASDGLFAESPPLLELRNFVTMIDPWNLFIVAFVILSIGGTLGTLQRVIVERYNMRILRDTSLSELHGGALDEMTIPVMRSLLGTRRRLLEHILVFVPAVAGLVSLSVALTLFANAVAGFSLLFLALASSLAVPLLVARFGARRTAVLHRATVERLDRRIPAEERAELRLRESADRAEVLIERPLVRLLTAWPLILVMVVAVSASSLALVASLAPAPGERASTLLVVLLVLCARYAVTVTRQAEELAFFASAATQLRHGDSGIEVL